IALQGKIKGFFDNFTVPVKGSVSISSEFLKGGISAAFSGVLHEPDNAGEIAFHTDRGSVYAIIDGKDLTLKGTLKDLDFVFNRIKVAAGMVVLNLSVRDFNFKRISGVVGVPVLAVLPGGKFPEIDAVSGVYAEFKNGAVAVKDASFSFPGGWFTVNLSFADGVVDGDFKGFLSVKTLARKFLPSVLVKEGEAAVSGTFRYDEGFTYSVSVDSENVVGRVDYLLGTVKIDKFSLKFQNGRLRSVFAAVEVEDGNILISGGDVITASIFNLPVGQRGFWRARVTGNLRFTGKELAGNVNVSRPVILKLSAGKKKRTDAGISIPFNVDIDVNFLEPLEFKTDLWSIKLLPVLKVTVINGLPVISGNFFVLDGKINYMGKEFVISYGSGIVDNLVELKGNVNIAASSKIGDYYVYMFVRGTLASPVLYFSSEPPLTKEEILSLIMTGATPSEMERSNELFPVVQVAYYATSTLLKPVEKTFSKLFKLESFSVEPYITRYGETVIKLSVAKRIGDRLRLIGYQTTGQDPEFSVGAQYFVGHYKNVYLEYQYSNYYHNEYGVGFNFKVKDWIWLKEKVKRKLKKLTQ
ncbi:translocation/assembly module TamB domain-containing protein, partial [Desulfurobacterium sp.]